MSDVSDITDTTVAKSDQLNADDLIGNTITVKVLIVKRGSSDQPIAIHIGGNHMPFMPCKSVRRALIAAWGKDGNNWVGKSMTLYNDPTVKWGGVAVGGIRVSHLSDIDNDITVILAKSRGKKSPVIIKKLVVNELPECSIDDIKKFQQKWIDDKWTADRVISAVGKKYSLSQEQIDYCKATFSGANNR